MGIERQWTILSFRLVWFEIIEWLTQAQTAKSKAIVKSPVESIDSTTIVNLFNTRGYILIYKQILAQSTPLESRNE